MQCDHGSYSSNLSCPRCRLAFWIRNAQDWYDRRGTIIFFALSAFLAASAWLVSRSRLLWFDELLGLAAATAPNLRGVISALAIPVDFNPPIYHLLARCSIALFGYSSAAARLPALAGMLVFLACLFTFVSRRLKRSFGVLAALLILCTPVYAYAWEARPYSVVLAFTGLALLAYQSRTGRGGWMALAVFAVCCGCLPLTHYYGLLILAPFAAAEMARTMERRQFDWPLIMALIASPAIALSLIRNLIRSQRESLTHYHSAGSLSSFITGYELLNVPTWVICIALMGLILLIWCANSKKEESRTASGEGFSAPEIVLAAGLLLLPLIGAIVTRFTHAYLNRYFMAACAGLAILVCYLLAALERRYAGTSLLVSAALFAGAALNLILALQHRRDLPAWTNLQAVIGERSAPILFQDPKDYVLAYDLNPSLRNLFYYAAEPELSLKMIGTDTDDKLMRALATLRPLQVARLDDLARKSSDWVVIPGASGWLVPCLEGMGAEIRLVALKGSDPNRALSGYGTRLPELESSRRQWCEQSTH